MTELDIATAVADGQGGPQRVGNSTLVALRITGTGIAAREKHDELVHRPLDVWQSATMQLRCTGLPIVLEHPESGILDAETFRASVVGIVVLAFARASELWGVGRFFDHDLADEIARSDGRYSFDTSPSVVFAPGETETLKLADGSCLLVEGEPSFIDHLALVASENGTAGGVWSRGRANAGIDHKKETKDARH